MIWIVRHGQSAGNVAREAAEAAAHPLIDIAWRDMDTPLSALGEEQARALGRWFAQMPPDDKPTVILCSPYIRARETARIVADIAGIDCTAVPCQNDDTSERVSPFWTTPRKRTPTSVPSTPPSPPV